MKLFNIYNMIIDWFKARRLKRVKQMIKWKMKEHKIISEQLDRVNLEVKKLQGLEQKYMKEK